MAQQRQKALRLYADIIRAARLMPTPNRIGYIKAKARDQFRDSKALAGDEAEAQYNYGLTMLDQIKAQAKHLTKVLSDPRMHGY